MAIFDAYNEGNRDPKYDFREPDGPKASSFWGDVFKGGADLLDKGIKATDTAIKLTIDREAESGVTTLRNQNIAEYKELTGNVLAATQTPQNASRTGTGAPTEGSGSDGGIPIDGYGNALVGSPGALNAVPSYLAAELRPIDKMNEARRQGHFDSTRFFGEVQERAASLISRYPGYSDYIQSKITHYLGTDPANAQRQHLQETIKQLIGTSHTETAAEKWNHEVMTYSQYMGGDWVTAAFKAGNNPEAQAMYRAQAATQKNLEHKITAGITTIDYANKARTLDEDTKTRTFTSMMDFEYGKLMNTSLHSAGDYKFTVPDIHASIDQQRLSGVIDTEGNAQKALAMGSAQQQFMANFEKEWIKPRFNMNAEGQYTDSFSTIVKDPNAKANIMKKYNTGFDSIKEALGAGNFHVATMAATLATQKTDIAVLNLLKNEALLLTNAGAKAFGPAFEKIYGIADTQSKYNLSGSLAAEYLRALQVKNVTSGAQGGANTLWSQFKKAEEIYNADPRTAGKKPSPIEMETMVTQLTNVIAMPAKDVPTAIKMNVMEVLSHPDTVNYLDQVNKAQQFKAYGTLFAPDVTNFIKDHKATEMWTRYKDTAGQSFAMIYGNFANDLKVQVRNDYRGSYKWNEETQQIDYVSPDRNSNPAAGATRMLNQGLRVYAGILAAEGQKITPETLKALGINLDRPEGNPTLEQIRKIWNSIPQAIVPSTSVKRDEGTALPPGAREGRPRRNISTPEDRAPSPVVPSPKEDGGNGDPLQAYYGKSFNKMSAEDVDMRMSRPLFINGVPVVEDQEKRDILTNVVRTHEGKYYWHKGKGKLVPINL